MTSAPSVSVITISFKDLDGLKRTVESVRAQRDVREAAAAAVRMQPAE